MDPYSYIYNDGIVIYQIVSLAESKHSRRANSKSDICFSSNTGFCSLKHRAYRGDTRMFVA